jgi:hypothetical protein
MYTSGRTVKTRKPQTTAIATATADARRLIARHLPSTVGVTVRSVQTADPATLAPLVRTTITFGQKVQPCHVELGGAITYLPGYVSAINDDCSITYLRAI